MRVFWRNWSVGKAVRELFWTVLFLTTMGLIAIGFGTTVWEIAHLQIPFDGLGLMFVGIVVLVAVFVYPMAMPRHQRGGR